jgi:prevent-host-death family protein
MWALRSAQLNFLSHLLTERLSELYSSLRRTGVFMPASSTAKSASNVVSALNARANFGKLLARVDAEHRSVVIEKRGIPRAILLSIQDYVKLAAPEPEILRIVGEAAKQSGASRLSSRQIDQIIRATRAARKDRKKKLA